MATTNPSSRGESWLNRVIDRIKPQPALPESPAPPPVDQTAWEQSVNAHRVNALTVHDVGLIVFNEAQSFTDSDKANDIIGGARQMLAHAMINGDSQFGRKRPITVSPIEPRAEALKDSRTKAAYDSSIRAAREAYLSPTDPTQGAIHFKFLPNGSRADQKFGKTASSALPIRTQSGPFNNSYIGNDVHSRQVYVNPYATE
jgi:hypothetical protein